MLLPKDIHPEDSIYYNGAFVFDAIQQNPANDLLSLFQKVGEKKQMSMPVFVLCLDWLFLLNTISMNERGQIESCI